MTTPSPALIEQYLPVADAWLEYRFAFPKAVAHTTDLGSVITWRRLIDLGLIVGNRITDAGRDALDISK